ncbi:MAG: rhodanese-like domain-containing protein [Pseudanabaenales cyanobacterium]|nr:rhodanese-like domain-containing protein [Pseudanabaenales cyanobacterium]
MSSAPRRSFPAALFSSALPSPLKNMHEFQCIVRRGLPLLLASVIAIGSVACSDGVNASGLISQADLAEQIEAKTAPIILDVRTAREYRAGHIPGAINIHYRELPERLEEVSALGGQEIVVYCERGIRANFAERTLQAAGFKSILHLDGDMVVWRANDLPIEEIP